MSWSSLRVMIVTDASKFSHVDISSDRAVVVEYNSETVVSNLWPKNGAGSLTTTKYRLKPHFLPSWNTVLFSCSSVGLFLTCKPSFWFPVVCFSQLLPRKKDLHFKGRVVSIMLNLRKRCPVLFWYMLHTPTTVKRFVV